MGSQLEQILRLGCSVEVAAVYEAVGRLCDGNPSQRLEYIQALERAYRACEGAHAEALKAIEEYKTSDGDPATLDHTWKPG